MDSSIDKKNLAFIVPIIENGQSWTLYIPAPSKERTAVAAPVLGSLFSLKESSKLSGLVLARDYEIYAKKACNNLAEENVKNPKNVESESDRLFNDFCSFLTASFAAGTAISPKYETMRIDEVITKKLLSEDALDLATGMYVFFYATLRYASIILTEKEKQELSTYLKISDYIKHIQTSLSDVDPSAQKAIQ